MSNLKNYKLFSNKYKFILLNNINKNSKVLFYIRYNHLKWKPLNDLKKNLSKKNVLKMYKRNILIKHNKNSEKNLGYGSICVISTEISELLNTFDKIKKQQKDFELLFVQVENNIYSKLKFVDIINQPNPFFQIKKTLYFLSILLKNINKKADIT
jgi:ribosomal protein L10